MKNKLPEPVKKIRIPKSLRAQGNGTLQGDQLRAIKGGGMLWYQAAAAWNRMYAAALQDGVRLECVSFGYRSLPRQKALFLERYSLKKTLRRPEVTREWDGRTWYLKRGKSPSATPGTSNHGWGLAQDIKVPRKTFRWMCLNAPRFGFYLQGHSKLPNGKPNPEWEAWHWQFCDATEIT